MVELYLPKYGDACGYMRDRSVARGDGKMLCSHLMLVGTQWCWRYISLYSRNNISLLNLYPVPFEIQISDIAASSK